FAEEPLPPGSPLRQLPNAILTPHAIGHTQESIDALPNAAIENVSQILRAELPLHLRNPDVIPHCRRRSAGAGQEGVRSSDKPLVNPGMGADPEAHPDPAKSADSIP